MELNFQTRSAPFEERQLHAAIARLENAAIALFWEGDEPRLGTLTVTLPNRVSSTLLGDRDSQISLILGSQLAALTGKMALVSTNLQRSTGMAAGKVLLGLARDIVGYGEREQEVSG